MKIKCYQHKKDNFIYETNFMITTKPKSREEMWNIKNKTEKSIIENHQPKIADRIIRKRKQGSYRTTLQKIQKKNWRHRRETQKMHCPSNLSFRSRVVEKKQAEITGKKILRLRETWIFHSKTQQYERKCLKFQTCKT